MCLVYVAWDAAGWCLGRSKGQSFCQFCWPGLYQKFLKSEEFWFVGFWLGGVWPGQSTGVRRPGLVTWASQWTSLSLIVLPSCRQKHHGDDVWIKWENMIVCGRWSFVKISDTVGWHTCFSRPQTWITAIIHPLRHCTHAAKRGWKRHLAEMIGYD